MPATLRFALLVCVWYSHLIHPLKVSCYKSSVNVGIKRFVDSYAVLDMGCCDLSWGRICAGLRGGTFTLARVN